LLWKVQLFMATDGSSNTTIHMIEIMKHLSLHTHLPFSQSVRVAGFKKTTVDACTGSSVNIHTILIFLLNK